MNEKTLTYNEYDVYYYTNDLNKKETVLFLHPAFSDHTAFVDQFDSLSDQFNLITLDMIGHGKTQPKKTTDDIEATIQHMKDILTENHLKTCHIVGVSLGSLVAQGFAEKHPDITKSVTVVGGYSIHNYNQDILKAQQKAIFKVLFRIIFNMNSLRRYVSKISTYHKHAYERFYSSSKSYTRKSLKYMQGMQKIFHQTKEKIPYPLLIVYGEHDLDIGKNHAKLWHKQIPESKLHIVEDAGHCVNMEQPEKFDLILLDFIENLRP
ncbi:alpha/beta fold hydrolase [Chengkuizengella axinellae]|uniref:Alpha/beta hydrolase n=1 Tax=Chengkuizengella axinellae TaxID=3064388 RepID=A0ABT9J2N0_9BACL|nr:alpha/beta hydrolase [Chengkuizengella sp. 2205SS18-9]MDP5275847.1 alpha/beta hydrolase [Chengkuizengella sp. 2205SS18-9]